MKLLSGDPCTNFTTLPDLTSRYLTNAVTSDMIDDSSLPDGWYKAEGILMLREAPGDIYSCGTKYPIWLDGKDM